MLEPNISRGERNSRMIMAVIFLLAAFFSFGPWFYVLAAVLLGFSGVTGQCGMIKLMNQFKSEK
jgi:hypothetical protein